VSGGLSDRGKKGEGETKASMVERSDYTWSSQHDLGRKILGTQIYELLWEGEPKKERGKGFSVTGFSGGVEEGITPPRGEKAKSYIDDDRAALGGEKKKKEKNHLRTAAKKEGTTLKKRRGGGSAFHVSVRLLVEKQKKGKKRGRGKRICLHLRQLKGKLGKEGA